MQTLRVTAIASVLFSIFCWSSVHAMQAAPSPQKLPVAPRQAEAGQNTPSAPPNGQQVNASPQVSKPPVTLDRELVIQKITNQIADFQNLLMATQVFAGSKVDLSGLSTTACANIAISSAWSTDRDKPYLYYLSNQTGSLPVSLQGADATKGNQICFDLSAYSNPGSAYTEVWALILKSACKQNVDSNGVLLAPQTPCSYDPVALLLPKELRDVSPSGLPAAQINPMPDQLKGSNEQLTAAIKDLNEKCNCVITPKPVAPKQPLCKDKNCRQQREAGVRAAVLKAHQSADEAAAAAKAPSVFQQSLVKALGELSFGAAEWAALGRSNPTYLPCKTTVVNLDSLAGAADALSRILQRRARTPTKTPAVRICSQFSCARKIWIRISKRFFGKAAPMNLR